MMRKQIITIAIVLGLSMTAFAGQNDGGLFQRGATNEAIGSTGFYNKANGSPMLPAHGETTNQNAPLGSGISRVAWFWRSLSYRQTPQGGITPTVSDIKSVGIYKRPLSKQNG